MNNPELDNVTEEREVGFIDHIIELRNRLLQSLLCVIVLFGVAFYYYDYIVKFITDPLSNSFPKEMFSFTVIKVTEAFVVKITISAMVAIITSTPIVLYHVWRFVAPGLYANERLHMTLFIIFGTVLMFAGAALSYFLMPYAFTFLLQQIPSFSTASISIGYYTTFVIKFMLCFGVIFELPIVLYFLVKIGVVPLESLTKHRGIVYVLFFIIAAIVTPPDVLTQIFLAIPMIILYEASIIMLKISIKHDKEEDEEYDYEEEDKK